MRSFSPDGRRVAIARSDGVARIWDVPSPQVVQEFKGHSGPVYRITYSRTGQQPCTAGEDGTLRIWDVGSGREARQPLRTGRSVYALAVSADGRLLLVVARTAWWQYGIPARGRRLPSCAVPRT